MSESMKFTPKIVADEQKLDSLTPSQLGCILNEASMAAKAIERFSIMMRQEQDERDLDALYVGVECLSKFIGGLSDMAAHRTLGTLGPVYSPSIVNWMLPESFRNEDGEAS